MSVAAIILAAGGSSRLGRPKQLLPYKGTTLLHHAVENALGSRCRPIVVVLGANAGECRASIADLPADIAMNENWQAGMGSSIAAGIAAITSMLEAPDAAILMLCDQPSLSPAHLELLADAFESGAGIAASEYGGSLGVPALFSRSFFSELAALDPSQGAKPLIAKYADRVAAIPFPAGDVDIDTPADYEALFN